MKQPEYLLENGTRVRTHDALGDTSGMFIKQETLDRRQGGITGVICGIVAGHGGDVYWVRHDGIPDTGSAYGFWEFELVPTKKARKKPVEKAPKQETVWDAVKDDKTL